MIKTATRMTGLGRPDDDEGSTESSPPRQGVRNADRPGPQGGSRRLLRTAIAGGAWLPTLAYAACFALVCWLALWSSVSLSVRLAALFGITSVVSALFTRFARKAAPRLGLVDRPDSRRKLHASEMPLGGGLAILASTGVVGLALLVVPSPWQAGCRRTAADLLPLLAASAVIVAVGVADDRIGLRGRHKLLGQCVAAGVLMVGGFLIHSIGMFGWHVELGLLSAPFTLFWLLGAMNALNLLDGIDGLVTTVGLILVAAIAGIAAITGRLEIALAAVVFAGSLSGFLIFNLPPATIFLGDAGSMLIGLVIGVFSIEGSLKGPGTALLAAPLAIWTIPVFDSAAAVLRRKLTGRTLYAPDRSHIHHRLLNRLGSNRRVLGLIGVACVSTAAAALVSVYLKSDVVALVTSAAVVAVFVLTGLFGRVELFLLIARCRRVAHSFLQRRDPLYEDPCEEVLHLQGSRNWETLWETLAVAKLQPQVTDMRLNIHWPAEHEEFHATWRRRCKGDADRRWRMDVPLLAAPHSLVGSLTILGEVEDGPTRADLEPIVALLNDFESHLKDFVCDMRVAEPVKVAPAARLRKQRRAVAALARSRPK